MELLEQTEFDLVIIGTGFIESIIAAAAAKSGKTVLQLDPSPSYGSEWASLHLDEFITTLSTPLPNGTTNNSDQAATSQNISNVRILRPGGREAEAAELDSGSSSQYNIDLAPKVVYGGGPLIGLLLGSSAHHYLEFKLIQGSYMYTNGSFLPVPSSRPEIFRDTNLGPLQKRALMRFLKGCQDALLGQGNLADAFDDRPFGELLAAQRLDPTLQNFILYGVLKQSNTSLDTNNTVLSAREALELFKVYGESVGRYGVDTGPFLTPLYGCGDLPQAFCRVAAVGGTIQLLGCPLQSLIFDHENTQNTLKCSAIQLGGTSNTPTQIIKCGQVSGNAQNLHQCIAKLEHLSSQELQRVKIRRCVAIVEGEVWPKESQTIFVVPPSDVETLKKGSPLGEGYRAVYAVHGLVVSHSTAVCPVGKAIVYLWKIVDDDDGDGIGTEEERSDAVLHAVLDKLVDTSSLLSSFNEPPAESPHHDLQSDAEASSAGSEIVGPSQKSRPLALFAAFYTTTTISFPPSCISSNTPIPSSTTPSTALESEVEIGTGIQQHQLPQGWPVNVVLCPGPTPDPTFYSAVYTAKALFRQLYPEVEGFPLDPGGSAPPQTGNIGENLENGNNSPGNADSNDDGNHHPGLSNDRNRGNEEQQGGGEGSDDEALAALRAALGGLEVSEDGPSSL